MKESVICFKFLLIVLLSLLPTAKVKAAPSGEPLISLEVANASLQKLLPLLEEQAGVTFTYESSLLKNMPQINISSNPQLSSSASFLRLNVLSSLN